MAQTIIDLSVAIRNGIASDPPSMVPEITYRDHAGGVEEFQELFPGLRPDQIPDRAGPALEFVRAHHAQRHAPRRALALPPDDGRRQARAHHRRGATRMVLR